MDIEGEIFDDFGTIEEGHEVEVDNNEDDGDNNQEEAEEVEERKKVIKPKKVVRNPRVRLNVDKLLGPRGLPVLTSVLEKCKLKGKGFEREDLNKILSSYKYWCHRMSPKTPFDQAIEIIEKLGTKRPVMTHLKKVRSGFISEENNENSELIDDEGLMETETQQQPEQTQSDKSSSLFDTLLPPKPVEKPIELSEEQKERIRANKVRAMKLKEERLRRLQEQKENSQWENSSMLDSQDLKRNEENTLNTSQVEKRYVQDSEDLFSQVSVDGNMDDNKMDSQDSNDFINKNSTIAQASPKNLDYNKSPMNCEENFETQDSNLSADNSKDSQSQLNSQNDVDFNRPESPIISVNTKKVAIPSTIIHDEDIENSNDASVDEGRSKFVNNDLEKDTEDKCDDTEKIIEDSETIIEDSETVIEDFEKITEDTKKITEDTEKITEDTEKITEDTEKITEETSDDTMRITEENKEICEDTEKFVEDSEKITEDTNEVSEFCSENFEDDDFEEVMKEIDVNTTNKTAAITHPKSPRENENLGNVEDMDTN